MERQNDDPDEIPWKTGADGESFQEKMRQIGNWKSKVGSRKCGIESKKPRLRIKV